MPVSFAASSVQVQPKAGRPARALLLRLAWLCLFLLSAVKVGIGLPQQYAAKGQVCLAAQAVCSDENTLNPRQVDVLQQAGISLSTFANLYLGVFVLARLVWGGIGLLIFFLRPDDWLVFIASGMMILFCSAGLETSVGMANPALALPADLVFNLGNLLMFLFIALFPGGRFSPRWTRWYWLGMGLFGMWPSKSLAIPADLFAILIATFWISFLILGPYGQIYRYLKESNPVERLQTRWVVFGFVVFAGSVLFWSLFSNLVLSESPLRLLMDVFYFELAGMLIPLSIGFSIFRYRLWDIDLIIRRTLVYSLLTVTMALVYFGGVTLLQSLFTAFSGQDSPAALVISTLLIAALFNPLRRRLQDFIDRRFYRQKYDAEQALAAFAAAARSEADLQALTARLVALVQTTIQPDQVSLWQKKVE